MSSSLTPGVTLITSLVPKLFPSTHAIYVRISNTREGGEPGRESCTFCSWSAIINVGAALLPIMCITNAYVNCAHRVGEPGLEPGIIIAWEESAWFQARESLGTRHVYCVGGECLVPG